MSEKKVDNDNSQSEGVGLVLPQLMNPIRYAKILIQLGYEPLLPYKGYNIFSIVNRSKEIYRYPWIGKYMYFMLKERGFYHLLSTGFFARFLSDSLRFVNDRHITKLVCKTDEDLEDVIEECDWPTFFPIISQIVVLKAYEVIITHPFKVIMTRQMADFIVMDTKNAWFTSACSTIYHESGLSGFYKGFAPTFISELCKCAVYYSACRVVHKILNGNTSRNRDIITKDKNKTFQLIPRTMLKFFCSNVFYPFEVVSTVMMLDEVRLGPHGLCLSSHLSWKKCWHSLREYGQLQRGYSVVFRNHVPTTVAAAIA